MTKSVTKFIPLLAILLMASAAFGEIGYNYRSKLGFDMRALKTNGDSNVGWLVGLRATRFFGNSLVFMGLAGSYGAPTGRSNAEEYLYYGGVTVGVDGKIGKKLTFELSFLSGYGEGHFLKRDPATVQISHFVFEPSASIGIGLGGGWRLSFATSYLHLPEAPDFCGPTIGLRFEHRSSTAIREIND
ncbi:MAG: hypothetical protein HYR96_12520 [Deltaproteobacteria bacterium]|nr:hypothetical protein [Deltaproteobacteria bacterium]MBI3296157.1 hypothetical protein [Deltaproteobacteria bacterium]